MSARTLLVALALALFGSSGASAQESGREVATWPDGSPRLECEQRTLAGGALQRHGEFQSWHANGQLESKGNYAEGWRVGSWSFWHANGQPSAEGAFREGLRNSRWRYWDTEGKVDRDRSGVYRAEIEAYESGARRIGGEYLGKHRSGSWSYLAEDGVLLAGGEYARDRRSGRWTFHWPADGSLRYEGEYLRDEREGPWRFHLPGGQIDPRVLSGVYEKGKRTGDLPADPPGPLDELPAPRLPVGIEMTEHEALRLEVARFLEDSTLREQAKQALLARGREALPAVLETLIDLDLARQEQAESAFLLNYELLAPMHRGHAYRLTPRIDADEVRANRLSVARWLALWESTRDLPGFVDELPEAQTGALDSEALFDLPFDAFAAPAPNAPLVPVSLASTIARDPRLRKKALKRHGGTGTEESLALALDWLLRHQARDGRWSSSNFGMQCAAAGAEAFCAGAGRGGYDVGVTSLALLALMGDGSGPVGGPHADSVRLGLEWLLAQQDTKSGLFGDESVHEHAYGHALATLAVCRALRSGGSPELVPVLEKARDEILRRQLKAGGWRYDTLEERPDSSISAWMVHALVALSDCGLDVPPEATHFALKWMATVTEAKTGSVGYDAPGGHSARQHGVNDDFGQVCETLTAASLFAHIAAGRSRKQAPWMEDQVDWVLTKPPSWAPKTADFYGWYHASYALFHWGKKPWKSWNAALKEALSAAQVDDDESHEHGSFPTDCAWGAHGGRVYSTAICALMLEVYLAGDPLLD